MSQSTFLQFSEISSGSRGDPISKDEVGNQFCRITELLESRELDFLGGTKHFWRTPQLFGPPFCVSILKLSRTQILPHSLDFHGFCMIQMIFLSGSWNFYKLQMGDLISGGNQFCKKSELFGPPFCISILKVLRTQILRHSLDFSPLCMIREYFSQSLEISTN